MERENIEDIKDFFKISSSKADPKLRRKVEIWNHRHKLLAAELGEIAKMESELVDQLKYLLDVFVNIDDKKDTPFIVKSLQDNIATSQLISNGCIDTKLHYTTLLESKGGLLEEILEAKNNKS